MIITQLSTYWDLLHISGAPYLSYLLPAISRSLLGLLAMSHQLWDTAGSASATWPRNALWVVKQGNQRSHLTSFQSLRYHPPSLLNVQCLENCYFIYFVVSGRRINLFPITPIWPESKVIFYFKHNKHTCFIIFSDNSNTCTLWKSIFLLLFLPDLVWCLVSLCAWLFLITL